MNILLYTHVAYYNAHNPRCCCYRNYSTPTSDLEFYVGLTVLIIVYILYMYFAIRDEKL